jgi:hypothetical protein
VIEKEGLYHLNFPSASFVHVISVYVLLISCFGWSIVEGVFVRWEGNLIFVFEGFSKYNLETRTRGFGHVSNENV